jgi:hypothetical protein
MKIVVAVREYISSSNKYCPESEYFRNAVLNTGIVFHFRLADIAKLEQRAE